MKIIIFLFLSFVSTLLLKAQTHDKDIELVSSIEEATNIILKDIEEIVDGEMIIISYEYLYNLDSINLSNNTFVKKYDYDLNILKKNDSLFLLKVLIDFDTETHLTPLLYRVIKHKKNKIELTYITIQSNDFVVITKKE